MSISVFGDVIAWWLEEIRSIVASGRPAPKNGIDIVVRTIDGKTGYEIIKRGERNIESFWAANIDELENLLEKQNRRRSKPTRLVFGSGRFVERGIADRRLPLSRSISAATLDVHANTPFRSSDIEIWLSNALPTKYFIVKSSGISELLSVARKLRLPIHSIVVDRNGSEYRIDHHMIGGRRRAVMAGRFTAWVYSASIAALLIGWGAIAIDQHHRLRAASDELDSQIAAATAKAREAKKEFDDKSRLLGQIASVRADRYLSSSAVSVWGELSRIVPDGSWLSDLEIAHDRVTMTGYSKSAATLVPLLESSDLFAQPEFQSAVVKAPGIDAEKFTISASIQFGGSQ